MEREEVVIDGDSTEDDDEVRIITPQSRKRRRRSTIMEDDEDHEQDDDVEQPPEGSRRQRQLVLGRDAASTQPMTLRTPTPVRRSSRNTQQLSIADAVARGERGRRQEEEEDDEVTIVQPTSAGSVRSRGSSGRKNRRISIQDSDEEQELELEDEEEQTNRRSSLRIKHKQQEKEIQHTIARKLDYPVLDNCLENLQRGPHYKSGDEDDEDYEDESEPEEGPPPTRKRKSLPREGERDNREKVYADGGEDLDEFIVGDDEVEYMDEDEEGVISVETSEDETGFGDQDEMKAMMEAHRTRDMDEWFAIYLEYLEECIVDPEMETKMRRLRSKGKYQIYDQAMQRIERQICARRDSLRVNVAWPDEMVEALKCASQFRSSQVSAEQDCDACNRSQHVATYHVEFGGISCDANELYRPSWMRHFKEAVQEATPVRASFEMGSVCHGRTLAYWQLLHAKQFWCILVDAKRKEFGDSTGRIASSHRDAFFKQEFGRYKRLVNLVEKFADDSKRIAIYMPNVWKKVTRRHMTSDFLPAPSRESIFPDPEPRRGTIDAFVAESDEERSEEDEEAVMEQIEAERQRPANDPIEDEQATDDEETKAEEEVEIVNPLTPRSESKKEKRLRQGAKKKEEQRQVKEEHPEQKENQAKTEKSDTDLDIDDLKCLVCDASPRNAGIVHGMYLHVYCCYACAKRQLRAKVGCLVCNRPIDRVLRMLPLSKEARKAIKKQGQD